MATGDWRIVMLIDGTDTEGKATYQQIYQHQDGRKACVGPGYCSDPDLEWLLLQKDRKNKAWNTRHTKRKKSFVMFFMQPGSSFSFRESWQFQNTELGFHFQYGDMEQLKHSVLGSFTALEIY